MKIQDLNLKAEEWNTNHVTPQIAMFKLREVWQDKGINPANLPQAEIKDCFANLNHESFTQILTLSGVEFKDMADFINYFGTFYKI